MIAHQSLRSARRLGDNDRGRTANETIPEAAIVKRSDRRTDERRVCCPRATRSKKKNEADLRPASRTTFAMTTLVDDARYDTMVIDVSCDEDETKVVGTTDGTMVSN